MTTINRVGLSPGLAPSRGARSASQAFRLPGHAAAEGASQADAASGIGALLMLQVEADPREKDRQARRDATIALDDLGSLQLALLDGRDLRPLLETLEQRALSAPNDPGLAAIIDEVRLRVRVEAARLARRTATTPVSGVSG